MFETPSLYVYTHTIAKEFFMFKCPRCAQEYPSYLTLAKHTRTAYKLVGEALYREYRGIKEIPT